MSRARDPVPLASRLRKARYLMQTWRRALIDGNKIRSGPDAGKLEPGMQREMERFDEAIRTISEAARVLREPKP